MTCSTRILAHSFSGFLIAITMIGLFAAPAAAQQWASKMFQERMHEFGDVQLGKTPVHKFTIENPFEETVHIQSVTSSCGCTIASASKQTLETWETAEIICKFNTPAVGTGFKQATVTVRFDKPMVGEAQLTVRGTIVAGITLEPRSIDFGQVVENRLPVKKVELTSSGDPYFRVRDVTSTFEHIRVQLQEKTRQNGLVVYEILTQLKESVPKGFSQGELTIVAESGRNPNGTPKLVQLPLEFSAKVDAALQVSPGVLSLGPLKTGQEASQKVFLKSDRPFKIQDVRCHTDAFRVKADREEKKVHVVDVTYKGTEEVGRHECELTFFVEYAGEEDGDALERSSNKMKAVVEVVDAD